MKRWLETIADGVFLFVLGCSATGALAAVYYLIRNWRISWIQW